MKRLLFVTPCLSFAGAEKILCWVAKECSIEGYDVHILNLNLLNNNSNFNIDSLQNIKIHTIMSSYKKGLNNLYRLIQIIKLSKKLGISVIISFTRYPCILSTIAGKLINIPIIISERGDPYQFQNGLKNKIDFMILNQASGCVFQTKYAQNLYSKELIENSVIIPNPVFKSDSRKWDENSKDVVISIGRLDNHQKRYDIMINGFEIFNKEFPNYELRIYGKGLDEEKIEDLIIKKGLNQSIKLMGLTTDPINLLCESKMFLITSDFEGVPNALLEAMSVGMPVISTDCSPGGARFLIDNKNNGILVPIGSSELIANALSEYALNKELRNKCARNASNVCVRFNPDTIRQKWITYIEKIIK